MWRSRPARGFSLLELVTVLTILALVLAVGVSALGRGGDGVRTRAAARDLAGALQATRAHALSRQTPTVLQLDLQDRTYRGPGSITGVVPGPIAITLTAAVQEQRGLQQGGIRFFPDGTSTGGTVLVGTGVHRHRVAVAWMSGRVTVMADPQKDPGS